MKPLREVIGHWSRGFPLFLYQNLAIEHLPSKSVVEALNHAVYYPLASQLVNRLFANVRTLECGVQSRKVESGLLRLDSALVDGCGTTHGVRSRVAATKDSALCQKSQGQKSRHIAWSR